MKKQLMVFTGVVIKNGTVLMTKRFEEECPQAHMKWELPGGKVKFGETPENALKRELLEETGVKVKIMQLLPFVQTNYWNYAWGQQQTFIFAFLCKAVREIIPKKDHHIHTVSWIPLADVGKKDSLPGTEELITLAKIYTKD